MRVLINGPLLSNSGYGVQARFALQSLLHYCKTHDDVELYVAVTNWGQTSWIDKNSEISKKIHELVYKTQEFVQKGASFDIHLQIGIPNEINKIAAKNILYTAGIETTLVSADWINYINQIDSVITVSHHSKIVFNSSKYNINNHGNISLLETKVPVEYVSYPVPNEAPEFDDTSETYEKFNETSFNYLVVGQWGPRKNIDATIYWFLEKFKDNPDVGLILKLSYKNQSTPDKVALTKKLKEMKSAFNDVKCKLYLVHGHLSEKEMNNIYTHPNTKCLINIAHGEGFGLPMFEAAYCGVPVLTHGWSGQADYLYIKGEPKFAKTEMYLKNIQPEVVWANILIPESSWAYVNKEDYHKSLENVYSRFDEYQEKALELKEYLYENFKEEDMYNKFCKLVFSDNSVTDEDVEKWLMELQQYD